VRVSLPVGAGQRVNEWPQLNGRNDDRLWDSRTEIRAEQDQSLDKLVKGHAKFSS
jgi:hypothetical protein